MANTQAEGVDFLFRCKPSFCREIKSFMRSNSVDKVLNIPIASDAARKSAFKKSTGLKEVPAKVQIRALYLYQ